jgi:serine/threonine protein kinase
MGKGMARRLPSPPPNLAGFTYIRVLGSGGFADVFLYEQNMPRRQVAVKVLLAEVVTPEVRRMFQAEANVMAQLSSHPSVLTVYEASVSADGRPYIVMEYCAQNLGPRFRRERIPVPEVLQVGIRIAGALETAHRGGVLHRDVKPNNILTTVYGNPVLSDFGIASTLSNADSGAAVGLSVPWSAPEVVSDASPGSVASEVWSLGATLYTLLAGRTPFEVPGKDNGPAELAERIRRSKPVPIDRADIPPPLFDVLNRSLSKDPERRQGSVLELARELQAVEAGLGLAQTPVELSASAVELAGVGHVGDVGESTRVRPVSEVSQRRRPRSRTDSLEPTVRTGAAKQSRMTRTTVWLIVLCAALAVALGITATVVVSRLAVAQSIPVVRDIDGVSSGGYVDFSWTDPGLEPGDVYQVRVDGGVPSVQRSNEFRADATQGGRVCVTVAVGRSGQVGAQSAEKCVVAGSGG